MILGIYTGRGPDGKPTFRITHRTTAAQIWAAWKAQHLTVGQVAEWQQRHGIYFDQEGNTHD
jgi:hypothetical protein